MGARGCPTTASDCGASPLALLGSITVDVQYREQRRTLSLLVVAGSGPTLLGRDWLLQIQLDWTNLKHLGSAPTMELQDVY